MHLTLRALLLLPALTLCSCASTDMDGMDETFHNTPEKQNAAIQAQDARVQHQEEYEDQFGGKNPYDYYLSKGESKTQASRDAAADYQQN